MTPIAVVAEINQIREALEAEARRVLDLQRELRERRARVETLIARLRAADEPSLFDDHD